MDTIPNLDAILAGLGSASGGAAAEGTPGKPEKPETPADPAAIPEVQQAPEKKPEAPAETGDPKKDLIPLLQREKKLQQALRQKVLGQDRAIRVFLEGYFRGEFLAMTDPDRFRPRATFLFAGSPGVGKTFLAQTAAEELALPFMSFDMTEYNNPNSPLDLTGLDQGYKNPKEGLLTGFVKEHPRCVLLFDEVEKAHHSVINLFLQILDAGRLKDNLYQEEISFKDAIVIFTTNAGKSLYEASDTGNFSTTPRKVILKAVAGDRNQDTGAPLFPPAICSRFASGNVIMFNRMSVDVLMEITRGEVMRHAKNIETATGWKTQIDEKVLASILFAEGARADARTLRARAEAFLVDEFYELMRLMPTDKLSALQEIRIQAELPGNPDIRKLFEDREPAGVLVFAAPEAAAVCEASAPGVQFWQAQTMEAAKEILKKQDVEMVLCDLALGIRNTDSSYLNIEDVETLGREMFWFLREKMPDTPVYLLETGNYNYRPEEKISILGQGGRDFLPLPQSGNRVISDICTSLRMQSSMLSLASANKVLRYGTAQEISEDGKTALIRLIDYKMTVATDPDDLNNVMGDVSRPDLTLDEVIGAADAKEALRSFMDYLKNPKKYMDMGIKAPQGILLYGPPGTGKTLMAKGLAGESGVTFIAAEGNGFLKKFVGEGPEKVHELFRTARKYAPSILFIDEIDAIAMDREGAGTTYTKDVLTALLTEMDGFHTDVTKPVFVLAATNAAVDGDSNRRLDPALLRRFDRPIYVPLPDRDARREYIRRQVARNEKFNISDAEIDNLANRSVSMSLSDLNKILNAAPFEAVKAGLDTITDTVLDEVFEKQRSGIVKQWNPEELTRTARHEAGHTLITVMTGEIPAYVTIVARGEHGGYMAHDVDEHKGSFTRREMLNRIRVALGGRAAEIVYYGEEDGISTGASGDLYTATNVARHMLCTYGMDADYGMAVINPSAPETADALMQRVNAILASELEAAVNAIRTNQHILDALVEKLKEQNYLRKTEIREICRELVM
ncbi:MAG: AAA family ATPase [Lachnospiraceae bacterium]|nr:AAA family ATPase [Lachnospiraceae bacterium]